MANNKTPNMLRFTQRTVIRMTWAWFVGMIFGLVIGAYAVVTEITTIDTVYNFLNLYVGAPVLGTLIGYIAKSAIENVTKMREHIEEE